MSTNDLHEQAHAARLVYEVRMRSRIVVRFTATAGKFRAMRQQ